MPAAAGGRCRSRLALAGALLAASGLACNDGLWYDVQGSQVFPYPLCEVAGSDMIWVEDDMPTDYRSAQRACAAHGARLLIIQDEAMNDRAAFECGLRSCWIGLEENTPGVQAVEEWTWSNMEKDEELSWSNGSSWTYRNWAVGEPNNYMGTDEDRAFINICGLPTVEVDGAAAAAFGIIYFFVCCGLPLGVGVTQCACLCYAHTQRTEALQLASQGKRAEPPSAFWRYCCGHAAVYYWEGCSVNLYIVCCLWPYFAICCWSPSQNPMENGRMVGAPVQVSGSGYGYGQPPPTVVGTIVNTAPKDNTE
eukprot:TRINITY_DN3882_c0_g1_i1.p1 TRINITY_DN3882_c0_g1~~TRINITY_DN3882_c0_g1_i1.p1  ORF type:complete len:308 (-),score=47.81 TRINITY_DN3882_c0_g1_i1:253-1176(-)